MNNTLYASDGSNLYAINANTGASTLVAALSGVVNVNGTNYNITQPSSFAITPTGNAYVFANGFPYFGQVNLTTGVISNTKVSNNFIETMAANALGQVFGVDYGSNYLNFNTSTGQTTNDGSLTGGLSGMSLRAQGMVYFASVPEPSSIVLCVISGMFCLGIARFRAK